MLKETRDIWCVLLDLCISVRAKVSYRDYRTFLHISMILFLHHRTHPPRSCYLPLFSHSITCDRQRRLDGFPQSLFPPPPHLFHFFLPFSQALFPSLSFPPYLRYVVRSASMANLINRHAFMPWQRQWGFTHLYFSFYFILFYFLLFYCWESLATNYSCAEIKKKNLDDEAVPRRRSEHVFQIKWVEIT